MGRKILIGFGIVAIVALVAPVASAASGSFSAGGSTTALTVSQSSSGRAISATSTANHAGVFVHNGTAGAFSGLYALTRSATTGAAGLLGYANNLNTNTITYGVYGQSNSTGGQGVYGFTGQPTGLTFGVHGRTMSSANNASGVFGEAFASSGNTNGVYGVANSTDGTGVFGRSPGADGSGIFGLATGANGLGSGGFALADGGIGMLGIGGLFGVWADSGLIGDGSFGLLSTTDVGNKGHVIVSGANLTGRCTVTSGQTAATCSFTNAFPASSDVIVTLTPTSNPGAFYWVSATSTASFTITMATAPGADVVFDWIAIGANPGLFPAANAGAAQRARVAHH